jgi:hypothetical protein
MLQNLRPVLKVARLAVQQAAVLLGANMLTAINPRTIFLNNFFHLNFTVVGMSRLHVVALAAFDMGV